jgi:alpha-galactosidase
MDGTVFVNDPDVVFMRKRNCSLTENEKELIALVDFLLASQVMFSDDPVHVDEAEAALTARIAKLYEELSDQAQPSDEYGATRIVRDVFRLESRSGKIAGLLNLRDTVFVLRPETDGKLAAALAAGTPLVDHRLGRRGGESTGKLRFAPRSITIVRV